MRYLLILTSHLLLFFWTSMAFALSVDDIPIAHTPRIGDNCGYKKVPPPILSKCTDPVAKGIPDISGYWMIPGNEHTIHRIEQCANRVVITGAHVIHDMRVDGTIKNGVHDVRQADIPACIPVVVSAQFVQGALVLSMDNQPMVTRKLLAPDKLEINFGGKIRELQRMKEEDIRAWENKE